MSISSVYIAAAANRFSQAADVSPSSLVAFGSFRLIALWNLTKEADTNIHEALSGHEGLVTCVRFASERHLVSADDRGTVIRWENADSKWKLASRTDAHSHSISALCILENCLVTGSSDTTVKVWRMESDKLVLVQSLSPGKSYPLALASARLPGSKAIILAISGTDKKVNIWLRSSGDFFVHSTSLAGHEDWIKSLAFRPPPVEDQPLILASASQDATIRLWRIDSLVNEGSQSTGRNSEINDDLLDTFEASLADIGDAEEGGRQISLKRHILTVKTDSGSSSRFAVTFDALLIGHEAGVTCLSWQATRTSDSIPTLLSSSTDSSVIMWSPSMVLTSTNNGSNAIWINRERFGDVGGQRLGGFVGATWGQNGTEALAWGWAGGWRRWRNRNTVTDGGEIWEETGAISGHNGPVKGLSWSPNGEYLVSTGLDQTSRLHSPIPQNGSDAWWHELGRPQVHGYDLIDAVFVNSLKLVSIADEKVTRVFEAPRGFVDSLENLRIARFTVEDHNRPVAANVPPLGLSNKAMIDSVTEGSIVDSSRRPFEGELAAITLWPEVEKVFGHGYELVTLAISHSRGIVATACKASSPEHAVVQLHDTEKFRPVGKTLSGHSLTVTRIAFSPDDRYILSVSRDRSWRLFELQEDGGYFPVAADSKSHGRIIWDCAWSHEGDVFATASRDKTVRIWKIAEETRKWTCVTVIKVNSGATAIDFSAQNLRQRRKLAVGLETGEILIFMNEEMDSGWRLAASKSVHVDQIHRLAWRPGNSTELASCSEDGTLRILADTD